MAGMPGLLALEAPSCEEDKVSCSLRGFSLLTRRLEAAGKAFHSAFEKPKLEAKNRKDAHNRKETKDGSDDEVEGPADASWKKKRKEGQGKQGALKFSPLLVGEDLYSLLEVNESASPEQLKKQYRKLVLMHHPDKQGAKSPEHGDEPKAAAKGLNEKDKKFIKIQEAYEMLSDPVKRRQYDSSLDFDEAVPEEVDESLGFFATFTPVFRRNSRWSTRLPVPDLGEEKTDMNKVHKFYDFWYSFESWRDFSMHDEYQLDDAEFREERRWMERQNQKIRKKYLDSERKRIWKLTEMAERLDPRIRAEREEREAKKREEKEKRARAKQEEEEAKLKEEEERRRRDEREAAEREEKERLEREQRKQDKLVTKSLRQKVKKQVQSLCSLNLAEMEELQELCLGLEAGELEALLGRLEALKAGTAEEAVRKEMLEYKKRKADNEEELARSRQEARKREEQKSSEVKEPSGSNAPWSAEELGLLAKGLQKFPGGMGGRWASITQMLNTCHSMRTEKEVVEKTKELSEGQSLRSMGSTLWGGGAAEAAALPKAKAAAAKAQEAPPPAGGLAAQVPEVAQAAPAVDEWSAEQQKALEAALQKFPASMDKNERWKAIAQEVPGKSKAQCVDRFKFLREQISKQKKGS